MEYVTGHTKRVRVGNSVSRRVYVLPGISQGTRLNPLLFSLFAEDFKIFKTIANNSDSKLSVLPSARDLLLHVAIDSSLTFVEYISAKANKIFGFIRRSYSNFSNLNLFFICIICLYYFSTEMPFCHLVSHTDKCKTEL